MVYLINSQKSPPLRRRWRFRKVILFNGFAYDSISCQFCNHGVSNSRFSFYWAMLPVLSFMLGVRIRGHHEIRRLQRRGYGIQTPVEMPSVSSWRRWSSPLKMNILFPLSLIIYPSDIASLHQPCHSLCYQLISHAGKSWESLWNKVVYL